MFLDVYCNIFSGEVIMVQDLGENRKAEYSFEIKSAHFRKYQITVHPIVSYYTVDNTILRESHIFLSDDITHDHKVVDAFTWSSLDILKVENAYKKLCGVMGVDSQYKVIISYFMSITF